MPFELQSKTDFQLFETMLVTRNRQVRHVERHLARLERSAVELGFVFDRAKILSELDVGVARTAPEIASRLRLTLTRDGRLETSSAPLTPLPDGRVDLLIESNPLGEPRPLAAHKTRVVRPAIQH